MPRLDITTEWHVLSGSPIAMQRFILDYYGADRAGLADFPHTALYAADGRLIGHVSTDVYPAITTENDRVYIDLAPLMKGPH